MSTIPLQYKMFCEFFIDHRKDAQQETVNMLCSVEQAVNQAIKEGADKVEIRYLNTLNERTNPFGNVGSVRVLGYRKVNNQQTDK